MDNPCSDENDHRSVSNKGSSGNGPKRKPVESQEAIEIQRKRRRTSSVSSRRNSFGDGDGGGGGFCAQIDAMVTPLSLPQIQASLACATKDDNEEEPPTPSSHSSVNDSKVLVEANISSWKVIQGTFISKRNERMNMIKSVLNNANDNQRGNFKQFQKQIMSIIEDYEMQKAPQMVLRKNFKLNSAQYFISILKKALQICEEIDKRVQRHRPEIIRDVKIDALYIYRHIIMATGAALRRVRTPLNQLEMCHRVAALVNGVFTGAYDADELCTTSLIQFVSGLPSYYSKIVPHIGDMQVCVNSIVREHGFKDEMRAMISLLIEMVSVLSKTISEKKPMNIVQGACLFLNPSLKTNTPNTARQIANYISSIVSQHNITKADVEDIVSLKLRKPLCVNFRNTKICALASLVTKNIEKSFDEAVLRIF